jgi:hypothetical protein
MRADIFALMRVGIFALMRAGIFARMRAGIVCSSVLSPLAPGMASGDQQPQLRPNRDVAVVYRAPGPQGMQIEQRVRWMAAAQTMRIDPPNPGLHVIVDYQAHRMSVIDDATRSVMEMAVPDSETGIPGAGGVGSYTRLGPSAVSGRPCTEWQALDRQGRAALICVTEDGVLLRAGTPETVRVSAISVQYAPQDAAAFRVPADYTRIAPGAAR